ncbi:hypothetical protein L1987_39215 [Smallanthus sonchifolius]|uniref:Uncharacterized protein n=1 Tax=Smallanthus sonchifolius TaxID=185202 RepID=A0ACB9HMS3_9ASTR|nr:hypothetical protein L1987_39215 [Smallanthus sonchifolius]
MRIRKNAKPSAFLHPNSTLIPDDYDTTLCLLNQSPWDIITFPSTHSPSPQIHLFDDFVTRYDVNRPANWSSARVDSGSAIQSAASSVDCDYDNDNVNVNRNGNRNGNRNVDDRVKNYESYRKEDKLGFLKGCVKEDNVIDLQNDAVWATNKKAQPVSKSRGTKKRAVAITPKQNEFYYYSGFGPSWGRKRGGSGNKCTTFNAHHTIVTTNSGDSVYESSGGVGDMDVEEDVKRVEPDTTTLMKTVWSCQVIPEKEDFDYVGEEEKNGKEKGKTVKKRGRKPIKARSLKSLM